MDTTYLKDQDSIKKISPVDYGFKLTYEDEGLREYSVFPFEELEVKICEQIEERIFTIKCTQANKTMQLAYGYKCQTVEQFEFLLFEGYLGYLFKPLAKG